MGASYGKRKAAAQGKIQGRFTALPHNVILSVEFRKLTHAAKSLLFDIAAQYNGYNNGKLVACSKYLKPLGWSSNDTINRALTQLESGGFLFLTRQGMGPPMSQPSWYALGWIGLDVTDGLDMSPKVYRRSVFTPLLLPRLRKMITPIDGAKSGRVAPSIGLDTPLAAPITGATLAKSKPTSAPIAGDLIYLPSVPAQNAGVVHEVIH